MSSDDDIPLLFSPPSRMRKTELRHFLGELTRRVTRGRAIACLVTSDGELRRILFTHRRSELQLNRRQRIRELVHLSDLADAHSVDEFRDPTSTAHHQLVDIVHRLTR